MESNLTKVGASALVKGEAAAKNILVEQTDPNHCEAWSLFDTANSAVREQRYEDAVDLYSQVLEALVPLLGQFAKELAPVYLAYGRALLQVGIENKDGLLNTEAMPESVVEGIAASVDGTSKRTKVVDLDYVTFEDEVGGEASEDFDDGDAPTGHGEEEAEAGPKVEEEDKDGEEDELELAWEILDIARKIYADSASMDKDAKAKLADVHGDLGDVSMEMESFKQAADEFFKAIEIKQALMGPVGRERELASLHFKVAMALEYDSRLDEALTPLKTAKALLQKRLDQLLDGGESLEHDKGKGKMDVHTGGADSEADELLQLIPDIEAKMEDIEAQIKTTKSRSDEIKSAVNSAAQGAIQDLTGLVRKRKADQSDPSI